MSNRGRAGHAYGALPDREKRYVGVVTLTTADGLVTPLEILWDDGRRFKVDKVTGRKQAHSIKTGGTGMRYSVHISGHDTFLWYDDYRKPIRHAPIRNMSVAFSLAARSDALTPAMDARL